MGVRLGRSSFYDRHGKARVVSKLQGERSAVLDDERQS